MPNYTVDASILNQFSQWIATTPPLFHGDEVIMDGNTFPHSTQQMPNYRGNSRLGFIYQHVCEQLIEQQTHLSLQATELQLNHEKRTIGELDFILFNHANHRLEHWEVAIKFYLLHDKLWYGPNASDRLDKKLNHMLHRQLQHSASDVFIQQYPQWQYLSPHLLMQGRLYVNPFEREPIPSHCQHKQINQSQISGYWCYRHQMKRISEKLFLLDKSEWAIGLQYKRPPLTDTDEHILHCQSESGRFWFIVGDQWPNNG
ncbi:DUF1853 family protein [Vibrio rarus]|uniref:DUF1853 family protein n=1 Tax=Vibrio rarus TaxID=413403 RepID=UPI0021C41EAE|nr:DUF1853 family protein [Vibrio rarus]